MNFISIATSEKLNSIFNPPLHIDFQIDFRFVQIDHYSVLKSDYLSFFSIFGQFKNFKNQWITFQEKNSFDYRSFQRHRSCNCHSDMHKKGANVAFTFLSSVEKGQALEAEI